MTFYYSMKQMFRSPLKSFLFFLLIGISAFFVALGGNLWNMSRLAMQEFEEIFTTIGTVEQVKKEAGVSGLWDAGLKKFLYSKQYTCGEWVSEDVLDFEGAGYVLEPKHRPYFGAYVAELYEGAGHNWIITVEVTPLKTAVADHSIPMRVEKVLEGALHVGDIIYVCEHFNPEPRQFDAGKTYLMKLNQIVSVHGLDGEDAGVDAFTPEYQPMNSLSSSQYTIDGKPVHDPVNEEDGIDIVTEGFYETERGKRWLRTCSTQDYWDHTVPVQPTDGTMLLLPFYRNEAVISEGRDITETEYGDGSRVCLISDKMAMLLGKSLGDRLNLPLYYANYGSTPGDNFGLEGGGFGFSFINAEGQLYSVFNEQEYEVVGIYTVKDSGTGSYGIGRYEVVIPWNAVPADSWKDNILEHGPMKGANTSFEIPNGSIDGYQKLWEQQGIDDLKITFYDKGYTQLEEGIENRKLMSGIFLISGSVMAVMILLFFSNLFITGQQERIAVERLLGRTKGQCSRSILTGLLVLAAAGCILGSVAGWKATGTAAKKADTAVEFDMSFSNSVIDSSGKPEEVEWAKPSITLAFGTGGGLLLAAFVISTGYMRVNLKKEPLQLLGEIEE